MELKDTMRSISNDARSWLKAWARDFTEDEARGRSATDVHRILWRGSWATWVLDAAGPAELDRPPRAANPYFHNLAQGVYEAALYENYHVGEIAALRKVLGKPRIG
jgi:hypothetical protein